MKRNAHFRTGINGAGTTILFPNGFKEGNGVVWTGAGTIHRVWVEGDGATGSWSVEVHDLVDALGRPIRRATGAIAPTTNVGAMFPVRNEVQAVAINGASGGTFTLTFDGATTAGIAWNAAAAAVKAAIELLANVTTVTVTGTGTLLDPWLVRFDDPTGRQTTMIADGALLTPAADATITVSRASNGTDQDPYLTTLTTPTLSNTTRRWAGLLSKTSALGAYTQPMSAEMTVPCLGGMAIAVTGTASATINDFNIEYSPGPSGGARYRNRLRQYSPVL